METKKTYRLIFLVFFVINCFVYSKLITKQDLFSVYKKDWLDNECDFPPPGTYVKRDGVLRKSCSESNKSNLSNLCKLFYSNVNGTCEPSDDITEVNDFMNHKLNTSDMENFCSNETLYKVFQTDAGDKAKKMTEQCMQSCGKTLNARKLCVLIHYSRYFRSPDYQKKAATKKGKLDTKDMDRKQDADKEEINGKSSTKLKTKGTPSQDATTATTTTVRTTADIKNKTNLKMVDQKDNSTGGDEDKTKNSEVTLKTTAQSKGTPSQDATTTTVRTPTEKKADHTGNKPTTKITDENQDTKKMVDQKDTSKPVKLPTTGGKSDTKITDGKLDTGNKSTTKITDENQDTKKMADQKDTKKPDKLPTTGGKSDTKITDGKLDTSNKPTTKITDENQDTKKMADQKDTSRPDKLPTTGGKSDTKITDGKLDTSNKPTTKITDENQDTKKMAGQKDTSKPDKLPTTGGKSDTKITDGKLDTSNKPTTKITDENQDTKKMADQKDTSKPDKLPTTGGKSDTKLTDGKLDKGIKPITKITDENQDTMKMADQKNNGGKQEIGKEKITEEKQNEKLKIGKQEDVYKIPENPDSEPSGHFMAYFLTAVVLCVAGYVIFHNKQKIVAFIVEGRNGKRTGSRRPNKGGYSKLKPSVDDMMPSLEKSTSSSNYIY